MWTLTAIAVTTGVLLLWIWKRFSKPQSIRQAKRQVRARLYAIRLYSDDPVLVMRAEGQLLQWIARYLAHALRPAVIAFVPLLALFAQLDAVYGHRPLAPGESAIVSARFPPGTEMRTLDPILEGQGITVETPAVRIADRREACWRVRARPVPRAALILRAGGRSVAAPVDCGSLHLFRAMPWSALPSIDVRCPRASLDWFGLPLDWRVWYPLITVLTMFVFRRRFGVVL